MNKILYSRWITPKNAQLLRYLSSSNKSGHDVTSSSSSSSSSDDDKPKKPTQKNQQALNKLNDLLKQMVEEKVVQTESKINLAKPKGKPKSPSKDDENVESKKIEFTEKQVVEAVKDVAQTIGGDVKQTESELLMKLLNPTPSDNAATISNISDILKGMKVDRQSKSANQQHSRAQQVRQILEHVRSTDMPKSARTQRKPRPTAPIKEQVIEKIDLFNSEPLGIFTKEDMKNGEGVVNKTWRQLYERELKLAVTHPPSNYFQQMILWTEQGKVWKFPIDNEQGMEEEQNVYFAEHVFLDKHLEPWCPPKGPIRHFMELVCVGLSKNPYLTVDAKKEHIEWFRKYFEEKKQLLIEVGALDSLKNVEKKSLSDK